MPATRDPGVAPDYYRLVRFDVLSLVPVGTRRVLSVGCATGQTERLLKDREGVAEVVGIEADEGAAREAAVWLDRVIVGDAEEVTLDYEDGYFDCILYPDVLEHLVDPWRVLKVHHRCLSADGCIIISVPNVRFNSTLWGLLRGGLEYQHRGIWDKTHLRFFTWKSLEGLITEASFQVELVKRKYRLADSPARWNRLATTILSKARFFDALFLFKDFFTFQFVVRARKLP